MEMVGLPPSNECPEKFVLIKSDFGIHVLAGWSGSYLYGSSWRLSTPIKSVELGEKGLYAVRTKSGSLYSLYLLRYGYTQMSLNVFTSYKDEAVRRNSIFEEVPFEDANTELLIYIN